MGTAQHIFKTASQSVDDPLEFVLSDDSPDRIGDVIEADGWQLGNFKKNPIALWAHADSRPIGTWEGVKVAGKRLIGRLKFAAEGTSSLIDELRSLVEQRILRTVSVGFIPLQQEIIRDKEGRMTGWRFISQELLECSLVSVPANPNALTLARGMNLSDAAMLLAFSAQPENMQHTYRKDPGESAVTARQAIAKAQAALSGVKK